MMTLDAVLPDRAMLTGCSPADVRRRIEALEALMERAVTVPGLNRPIGLDSVAGLVPVAGDVLAGAMGLYLLWEARNLGLSRWTMLRMAANVGMDTAIGAVPVVGDVFDFLFRSNSRNLKLIRRHLDRVHPASAVIDA